MRTYYNFQADLVLTKMGLYWPNFSLVFLIHLFLCAGVYCTIATTASMATTATTPTTATAPTAATFATTATTATTGYMDSSDIIQLTDVIQVHPWHSPME